MSEDTEEKLSGLVSALEEEEEEATEGISDLVGQQLDGISTLGIPEIDEDSTAADLMSQGNQEPPQSVPCTPTTMQCARGPCVHRWDVVTRMEAQEKVIFIQRTQSCAHHQRLMSLADENVFHCDKWKPAPLGWVPDSFWALVQHKAEDVWDRVLRMRGEDFTWRWWPRDIFERPVNEQLDLREAAINRQKKVDAAERDNASPLDDLDDL